MLFMHISNFKDHMTEQHADTVNNKKHICAECGRGFGRSRILKQHELTQHGKEFDDAHTCSEAPEITCTNILISHYLNIYNDEDCDWPAIWTRCLITAPSPAPLLFGDGPQTSPVE